jgi:hypothetical protein
MEMAETAVQDQQDEIVTEGERERSTIQFPYADLNNAKRIAVAIHEKGGTSLSWEQLAAHLGVAVRGGGFRLMAAAAKVFGLVNYSGQGNVQITSLGRRICDATQEAGARAEAFLNVALYKRIFDEYTGGPLPATAEALEADMVRFGVAKKVADRARQIFQRSAQQAGFFEYGQDRLVQPVTPPGTPKPGADGKDQRKDHVGGGGSGRTGLLQGLIDQLPPDSTKWPIDERIAWLELATGIFEFVYGKTGEKVMIKLAKDAKTSAQ